MDLWQTAVDALLVRPPFPRSRLLVDLTPEGVRVAEALGTRLGIIDLLDSSTSSCLQTEAIGRVRSTPAQESTKAWGQRVLLRFRSQSSVHGGASSTGIGQPGLRGDSIGTEPSTAATQERTGSLKEGLPEGTCRVAVRDTMLSPILVLSVAALDEEDWPKMLKVRLVVRRPIVLVLAREAIQPTTPGVAGLIYNWQPKDL